MQEITKLCKELMAVRQQAKENAIKSSETLKKKIEIEKKLNLELKRVNLLSVSQAGVAEFQIFDEFFAKVKNFKLAEPFLKEHELLGTTIKMSDLSNLIKKLVEEEKPLPVGIGYEITEKIKIKKEGRDEIQSLSY